MSLTSVVVKAKAKHTATVIWCHGLGDSGHGWSFLAEELSNLFPYVKWILPNAPSIPITLNGGMRMPGWFDLTGLDKSSLEQEDQRGILSSVAAVSGIIREEINNGIPSNRVVLGGFSQGCALSLLTGVTSEIKLGAIIGCSGWLPLSKKVESMVTDANKTTPILMCHGDADPVVRFAYGEESASFLKKLGYNVTFQAYPGLVHSANPKEMANIAAFLKQHLPPVDE